MINQKGQPFVQGTCEKKCKTLAGDLVKVNAFIKK
jgi:hypothetical protein